MARCDGTPRPPSRASELCHGLPKSPWPVRLAVWLSWSTNDDDIIHEFSQHAESNSPLQPASGPPGWWPRPAQRNTHKLGVTRLPWSKLLTFSSRLPSLLHSLEFPRYEDRGIQSPSTCRHASTPWGIPCLLFLTDLGHLIYATQPAVGKRMVWRAGAPSRVLPVGVDDSPWPPSSSSFSSPDPTASPAWPCCCQHPLTHTLPGMLLDRRHLTCRSPHTSLTHHHSSRLLNSSTKRQRLLVHVAQAPRALRRACRFPLSSSPSADQGRRTRQEPARQWHPPDFSRRTADYFVSSIVPQNPGLVIDDTRSRVLLPGSPNPSPDPARCALPRGAPLTARRNIVRRFFSRSARHLSSGW